MFSRGEAHGRASLDETLVVDPYEERTRGHVVHEDSELVSEVLAVEIGFPTQITRQEAVEVIQACLGELPLIARLPLDRALELSPSIEQAGAAAISLAPPRGALPLPDGGRVRGRLYGPSQFPQALHAVAEVAQLGIPIIGAGGVYSDQQAAAMLEAGALAVQVDTALWRGGWLTQIGE